MTMWFLFVLLFKKNNRLANLVDNKNKKRNLPAVIRKEFALESQQRYSSDYNPLKLGQLKLILIILEMERNLSESGQSDDTMLYSSFVFK